MLTKMVDFIDRLRLYQQTKINSKSGKGVGSSNYLIIIAGFFILLDFLFITYSPSNAYW
jgi:hypothetical protein